MPPCQHEHLICTILLEKVNPELLACHASHILQVTVQCKTCENYLHFLGLPAARLRDAPHPAGSEDDGTSDTVVYLPGILGEQ